MQNRTATRAWLPLAMALLVAACGTSEAPAPEPSDDADPASAQSAAEPTSSGDAQAAIAASDTCPPPGPFSETFDAAGTPLVFTSRHPAGFGVYISKAVGASSYKVDLRREIEPGDPTSRHATISILQRPAPGDSPIPLSITAARKLKDNNSPVVQASASSRPKPAETIDYGGTQVETFRVVTESKVIYSFNLPSDDGYRTLGVHFHPMDSSAACLARMEAMAAEWVGHLAPKPAG